MATTISVCALPLGGIAGSAAIFPDVLQKAAKVLKEAEGSLLTDSLVTHVADWLVLVMVHGQGGASPLITALKDAAVAAARDTGRASRLCCFSQVQKVQRSGTKLCFPSLLIRLEHHQSQMGRGLCSVLKKQQCFRHRKISTG